MNQQQPSTAHQQYGPKNFSGAETFQRAVVKEEGQPPLPPLRPPSPPSSAPMRPCPRPPPPKTKGTIVGNNNIYNREDLIGPLLVPTLLGPRPLPPPEGCIGREGTSEAAPEVVRQAVGGSCQSGWGRLLSVTNAIEAGTYPDFWVPDPPPPPLLIRPSAEGLILADVVRVQRIRGPHTEFCLTTQHLPWAGRGAD